MRVPKITSPNAFKTCYIADTKEFLGLPVRTAPNRQGTERKHKVPLIYREYIIQAIKELGEKATYKEIQKKAYEIYKNNSTQAKTDKYFGAIKTNISAEEVEKIINDEDFLYEN